VLLTCFLHFSDCFDNYIYGELSVKLIFATSFSTKLWLRQYLEHLSPNRLENNAVVFVSVGKQLCSQRSTFVRDVKQLRLVF